MVPAQYVGYPSSYTPRVHHLPAPATVVHAAALPHDRVAALTRRVAETNISVNLSFRLTLMTVLTLSASFCTFRRVKAQGRYFHREAERRDGNNEAMTALPGVIPGLKLLKEASLAA